MLLGTRKTLYDHIIEALLQKEGTVADILNFLKTKNISATIQGIYKALRELITEDIVVKQKKIYGISNVWRKKIENLVSEKDPFKLSPGEQTIYRFKKLDHVDAFWKHTLTDIEKEYEYFPVFEFTPHQFWSYVPGRKESEQEHYEDLKNKKSEVFTYIGGTSLFDKIIKESFKNDQHQVHLDTDVSFNRRDHIFTLGSYVITTRISKSLAENVDELYENTPDEKTLEEKLAELFRKPSSVTIVIENTTQKAKKFRKKMSVYFYVSKELRDKFDLF